MRLLNGTGAAVIPSSSFKVFLHFYLPLSYDVLSFFFFFRLLLSIVLYCLSSYFFNFNCTESTSSATRPSNTDFWYHTLSYHRTRIWLCKSLNRVRVTKFSYSKINYSFMTENSPLCQIVYRISVIQSLLRETSERVRIISVWSSPHFVNFLVGIGSGNIFIAGRVLSFSFSM